MLAQPQQHGLPLINAAGSAQQGFLRIINHSDRPGTVRIDAIDDSGRRFGPAHLSLDAMATTPLNSTDLEDGNASKGLPQGVGDGEGDWRLMLTTDLDLEPLAYIRTPDGFLTSMHDVVQPEYVSAESNPAGDSPILYHVRFFNPGSNRSMVSRLRLINTSGTEAVVTITGLDAEGASPPGGGVSVTLPAYAARTITAQQLEDGGSGFEGSFGDGAGKWQLFIAAKGTLYDYTRPIQVVSLLHSRSGNLVNLSGIGSGNDPNRGGDGVDYITGGSGDDVLNPGDNDDLFDTVYGSEGDDRIVFSDSGPDAYQWLGYSGLSRGINATINGITNRATVDKGALGTDTIVDIANPLDAGWNNGGLGLYGTKGDDVFNLTLDREQWMSVRGEAGNDTFNLRSHRWESNALQGATIRVNYNSSPGGIEIDLRAGRATNDGFGDVDTFTFNDGDFEIRGSNHSDTILGSDGDDRFIGRGGDDVIDGRGGYDQVRFDRDGVGAVAVDLGDGTATGTWDGEAFSYTLRNIEYVRGSRSAGDELVGGNGNDRFRGYGGDDVLVGGGGDDRLEGGGGDDVFLFEGAHGHDRVDDFEDGADTLLLLGLGTLSKQDILDHAYAWDEGTGVHIDLTSFGGGKIDLHGFHRDNFDASDFLI